MYSLIISPRAQRGLKRIRELYEQEVQHSIEELKEDPFAGKELADELIGKHSYRIDVYRIIYKVNKKDKIIYILAADHRSIVYKKG